MKKNVEINVELDAGETLNEIWNWDCEEQAHFLTGLAMLYKYNRIDFLYQLQAVSDEITGTPSVYNRELIVEVLSKLLEYLKEGGAE